MANPTPEVAIKALADEYFRQLPVKQLEDQKTPGKGHMIERPYGTVFLDKYQHIDYSNFVDDLFELTNRKFHRKGIVSIVDDHIVKMVHEKGNGRDKKRAAVSEVVTQLTGPEVTWTVYFPVRNLSSRTLPFRAGSVNFARASQKEKQELIDEMKGMVENEPTYKAGHRAVLEQNCKYLMETKGATWAVLEQSAITGDAARALALPRLRLVIDVLNFYSCSIRDYNHGALIYMTGEASNNFAFSCAIKRTPDKSFSVNSTAAGGLYPAEFKNPIRKLFKFKENGYDEAMALLNVTSPNPIQQRVLAGLHWAGRAATSAAMKRTEFLESDGEREESFLFYAICLESLFTKPKKEEGDGLTRTLTRRCCALIGRDEEDARNIKKLLGRVYDIRSRIVHQGKRAVPQSEFDQMRLLANECLVAMLLSPDIQQMQTEDEFEGWSLWNPPIPPATAP
jgi:hypothetical protein